MTLKQLVYFLVLAKVGGYREAAKACGVTQSTLSLMIQRLEENLGVTLFERAHNPIRLTPIGLRLKSHARIIVRNANQMQALAQECKEDSIQLESEERVHTM